MKNWYFSILFYQIQIYVLIGFGDILFLGRLYRFYEIFLKCHNNCKIIWPTMWWVFHSTLLPISVEQIETSTSDFLFSGGRTLVVSAAINITRLYLIVVGKYYIIPTYYVPYPSVSYGKVYLSQDLITSKTSTGYCDTNRLEHFY